MTRALALVALLGAAGCSEAMALPNGFFSFTDPRSISGCKAWLRSDLGITISTGVSTWANQASPGTGDATQSTGGAQPAYTTNSLNGRPGLTFVGPTTSGLQWGLDLQGAQTVLAVAKMSSTPSSASYLVTSIKGSTGPVRGELYTVSAGGYQNFTFKGDLSTLAASVGSNPTLDTSAHIYLYTYDGGTNTSTSSYTATYDGAAQTLVASGNVGGRASTDLGSIGAFITSGNAISNGFSGAIYEVIVYNRVLTADEKLMLYKYAKALYNL